MKKAAVLFTVIVFGLVAYAQSPVKQGSIMLNGTFSFSSKNYDSGSLNLTSLSFHPQAGYFLLDKLNAGLFVDYDRIALDDSNNDQWSLGTFLRYYFDFKEIKPFVNIGFAYSKTGTSSSENIYGRKWIAAGGVDYFVVPNVAIETVLRYEIENLTLPDNYNSFYNDRNPQNNTFFIGFGLNFFIY